MYSSTTYHNLTYFPDVYNCIIGGHLIDSVPFIEMIMKHSCIIEYLQIQEPTGPIIDQLMMIFMNCCSSRVPELNSDQILLNTLSTGPLTKKTLIRMLPEWFIEEVSFRQKVLEIAKLTSINTIGADAKLEITKHQLDNFDPFYWAFPMDYRLKAWSHFKEKRRNHLDHFYDYFMKNYSITSEIAIQLDFLIEMLLNFADSTSTDFEFALESVLIVFKAVCSISSDPECLERISDCIGKFKLKRNIPENILVFLSSISPSESGSSQDVEMTNNESSQESKARRKFSILASFKKQRSVFISEPQAVFDEDDEDRCVVCSESGSTDRELNFLGFPIQTCETSLISVEEKMCSMLRGCYHLVHKKCFDSLPAVSNECKFKMCTLCNSVIDSIVPLIKNTPKVPSELELIMNNSDQCEEYEQIIDDPLLKVFCSTLLYISECVSSLESLPLHQILTLTQLKRNLLEENVKKPISSKSDKNPISQMEILVSSFIFYSQEKISIENFSKIVSNFSLSIENVNFALNLFMFESISKSEIPKFKYKPRVPRINLTFKLNLLEIPDRHDLFLKTFLQEKCKNCQTIPRSAAVCLHCGTLVCVGQICCRTGNSNHGECYGHRKSCSGSVGIFFIIKNCALLIVSEDVGAVVPAPYVNSFGEHDFDLSSSSALFLNKHLYEGKLTEMWRNSELRDFILRNMDKSRISVNSWSLL